jgi:hypothetical protein
MHEIFHSFPSLFIEVSSTFICFSGICQHFPTLKQNRCAGSSGAVHSVFLIDVYLDLENPGGSGFWVGENGRVVGGNKEGQFTSIREQRWTDPDTEGGFQVSRQGEQGEQGEQGADPVHKPKPYLVYICDE